MDNNEEFTKAMAEINEIVARAEQARKDDKSYKISQVRMRGQPMYRAKAKFDKLDCGQWVAVRPIGDEYKGKTYLGILLGEIATRLVAAPEAEPDTLHVVAAGHNPAIFVPNINKVVFGFESWWGAINKPEDLRQITDSDINNTWYVKALKELTEASGD